MAHMTQAQWDAYRAVINEWQEDAFQDDITWIKSIVRLSKHGEDNKQKFINIELKGLVQYNYFRAWPITQATDSGEIDKESCMIYLNLAYLENLGYTNEHGQFKFNPGMDRFKLRGLTYKAFGDSHAGQAHDKPLFTFIILKREERETGNEIY